MIHGRLRYLEQLEIGLVCEALHERGVLLRIAPHLVRPIPHLIPAYGGCRKKLELRVGMLATKRSPALRPLFLRRALPGRGAATKPLLNRTASAAASFITTAW
jgi:glycerol-3-phosphate dehydrogenase